MPKRVLAVCVVAASVTAVAQVNDVVTTAKTVDEAIKVGGVQALQSLAMVACIAYAFWKDRTYAIGSAKTVKALTEISYSLQTIVTRMGIQVRTLDPKSPNPYHVSNLTDDTPV